MIEKGLHPAPEGTYRSPLRLSNVVIAFLTVNVVVDLASAIVDSQTLELIERVREGGTVTFEEADANYKAMNGAGILQIVSLVAAGIPFVMWMRRSYRNLGPLGVSMLRFKPGWAVGGWFVPFLWWARPKSILNDVWRASDPELPREMHRPPEAAPVPRVMNWWWGFYVLGSIVYPSATRDELDPSLESLESTIQQVLAGDVFFVLAGILGIVVVRKLTVRQERRHAMLSSVGGVPQPAAMQPEGGPS